jgi:hypothetical protein
MNESSGWHPQLPCAHTSVCERNFAGLDAVMMMREALSGTCVLNF